MLSDICGYMEKYGMIPDGGVILACVSGGADSMALLSVLCELASLHSFEVEVAHFDHGLRGTESDRDREFVAAHCESREIRCHIGYGDTARYAGAHKLGIEEAARKLRYEFFRETASKLKNARIATAHNADDNAETVLLNLARGAGARGLAGIPPVRDEIIRPMLCITRGEIENYLKNRGISFIIDSTNSSDIYARNKLRHKVMPVMREVNSSFSMHALDAGERLRRDDEYLFSLAKEFVDVHKKDNGLPVNATLALPAPVASRALTLLAGGTLAAYHIDAALSLCGEADGTKSVAAPRGEFVRRYDRLFFETRETIAAFAPVTLTPGLSTEIPGYRVSCREYEFKAAPAYRDNNQVLCGIINKSFKHFLFKKAALCGKIIVRPRASGDFIKIRGRGVTKSLKKLFIEERVPKDRRSLIPVVADDIGPLAVAGMCEGSRAVAQDGDRVYEISFERLEDA